jgi:hypothetical protein
VCSTIALKLTNDWKKYLGRLGGLYAKKKRFKSVATAAKQNSKSKSVQNWSLMSELDLSDWGACDSVSSNMVGIINPTAVPTMFTTERKANAKDLYFKTFKIHFFV